MIMKILQLLMIFWITGSVMADIKLPPLHHLVDVDVPDSMSIPDGFPLSKKGQIECATCHGIKDIKEIPYDNVDKQDADFFRQGPYQNLTNFCYQCHEQKQNQRPNIHILRDQKGELKKEQCAFCHLEAPEPDSDYDQHDLKFRLPSQKLCLGCHLISPHLNSVNHLVEVDDEMFKRIKQYEKEHQVILPLNEKTIQCITCHSSHENGVIDKTRAAARQVQDRDLKKGIGYQQHSWNEVVQADKKVRLDELAKKTGQRFDIGYQRLNFEVLLRLPAKDGTLCLACHKFDL